MADPTLAYWTPTPIFLGQTVFVLGGGPSLRDFDTTRLRGRPVAVVNSAYRLAPWADLLVFMDNAWFDARRDVIANFPGLVVSASRWAKRAFPEKVMRVYDSGQGPNFPACGADHVRHGKSSGHLAVSVLVATAAARIVLLGFDMRAVDGRTHFHDEYGERNAELYAEFIEGFKGWHAAALKAGTAIVNATPGSALTEFPAVSIDDELRS